MSRVDGRRRAAEGNASGMPWSERVRAKAERPASWAPRILVALPLALGLSGCAGPDESAAPGAPAAEEHTGEAAQAAGAGITCVNLRRQASMKAADTFVSAEKKDNNYGASSFAGITGAPSGATRALFRFDLGAIPGNATILSAGLSLTQNNTGAGTARLHVLNGQWNESTVTWNSLGASFGPVVVSVANNNPTLVFSVAAQVQAWVNGTVANNGFLLDQLEPSVTRFYTQEWVLAPQRPFLSVCYNVVCAPGFADCNGNAADGCEANLASPTSCGACGNACALAHASASCAAGACAIASCEAGFASCDGDAQNGCETSLATNSDCGGCGIACSLPNAGASCVGGACKITACNAGFFDCDGDSQNGCEPTPCLDGAHCGGAADCASHVCQDGSCAAPSCDDHAANGGETDADCGGPCAPCADSLGCAAAADCQSGVCSGGACQAPSCGDLVKNGGESDVDCGAACPGLCSVGKACVGAIDCASDVCQGGLCVAPSCSDGVKNGAETGVDCGGSCAPCGAGAGCAGAADCQSGVCQGGHCQAAACNDGVKNGGESDVDCGGSCADCGTGQQCGTAADCMSNVCQGGLCQAATCSDGVLNQGELAVDFGGPCPSTWRSALYPANWTPALTSAGGLFLHDFSYAGYHRSESPLPSSFPGVVISVMTSASAHPNSATDSRKAFVDTINAVIAAGGGVVYVPDGEYVISSPITIAASNVLIRGQSRASTKLFFSSIPNSQAGFIFKGADPSAAGGVALVADGVPRSKDVYVANASSFAVGNDVLIDMSITQAWIDEHGMNGIWTDASNNALNLRRDFFRRTITAIDTVSSPNKITLDIPLRYPMKTRDGAAIRLDTGAIREVGVEHLSVNNVATLKNANANPRAHVLWFQRVKDAFVRDVGTYASARGAVQTSHLQSGGIYLVTSKRITVTGSAMEHAQNHGDGGAGYAFEASMCNEVLFSDNVASDVRHAFIQNWDFGASGLVFLRCAADNDIAVNPTFSTPGTSELHHRLAIANLYDNTHDSSGFMAVNRTSESSYAGHTATQNVFWNVSGGGVDSILRSYQFGMGYIIGTTNITPRVVADAIDAFFLADQGSGPTDYLEGTNMGSTLEPQSLFEDQLARRLAP